MRSGLALWLTHAPMLLVACAPNPCGPHLAEAVRAGAGALRAAAAAPDATTAADVGLERLRDWAALPALGDARYLQFSSHNRTPGHAEFEPGGKDFNNFIARAPDRPAVLLERLDEPPPAGLAGYLLADVAGPGYLSRLFFTRFEGPRTLGGAAALLADDSLGRFTNEVLHIYVDDMSRPTWSVPLADLGRVAPFGEPLAGPHSAAVLSYTPISFRSRLRLALDALCPLNGYFYQVSVQQLAQDTVSFTPRLSEHPQYSATRELLANTGSNPNTGWTAALDDESLTLPPDATTTVFTDKLGGTIELLRFTFEDVGRERLANVRLLLSFDEAGATVDMPLDAFFGCREALAPFRCLPMSVEVVDARVVLSCYLPMPFGGDARVRLANDGPDAVALRATVGLDRALPPAPWGHLHATLNAVAGPQPAGSQHEVLSVSGRGRYVGTFLYAAGRPDDRPSEIAAALNILEGNETAVIDGETRIRGTGTEDYYNGGFYFATGTVNHPFSAANYIDNPGETGVGVASCCRWHVLADAVDFGASFALRFQYGADNPALVERYATVAYCYLLDDERGGTPR